MNRRNDAAHDARGNHATASLAFELHLDARAWPKRTPSFHQRPSCAHVDDEEPVTRAHTRAHTLPIYSLFPPPIVHRDFAYARSTHRRRIASNFRSRTRPVLPKIRTAYCVRPAPFT